MKIFFPILALVLCSGLFAQKKTFDIVTYSSPSGWKEEVNDSYISYSKTVVDGWGQMAIYKSTASKGDIDSDMQKEWEAVVLALHAVENDKETQPVKSNGWTISSRSGTWKYNGADVATILIVFSNGRTCVSALCNATVESYLHEFVLFTQSIELVQQPGNAHSLPSSVTATPVRPSSIVGLWGTYNNETSGYINGMPMTTGGYFRKEYVFYEDGTYLYRAKDWSSFIKEINFVYETGIYKITGSQLTLTPVKGKSEWWSKAADGRTAGWGSRLKTTTPKLEKISYSFEVKYLSGMERAYLYLRHSNPTERDGNRSSQANAQQEFTYGRRDKTETSMIDNPPGVKTGFEHKK